MNSMKYKLAYLPSALKDMTEIVTYISVKLQNKKAATLLSKKLVKAAEDVLYFPYSNQVYQPIRPLEKEYRRIIVDNYIMFYWIDEPSKTVIIARVLYFRQNYATNV